jgi:hypothetical protein
VGYFFIGKQKVVLFPKYRKNGWKSAASALRDTMEMQLKKNLIAVQFVTL